MNSKVYKLCAVPECMNTSVKTPNKLFITVPKTMRCKWLKLARRDPTALSLNTTIYFCEDHFDVPNDMENFMEYHLMGSVSKIRMKPGCIPTKFDCQSKRRKRKCNTRKRPNLKKQINTSIIIEECIKEEDLEFDQPCIIKKESNTSIEECINNLEEDLESSETSPGGSANMDNTSQLPPDIKKKKSDHETKSPQEKKKSAPNPSSSKKPSKIQYRHLTPNEKAIGVRVYNYVKATLTDFTHKAEVMQTTAELMGIAPGTMYKVLREYKNKGLIVTDEKEKSIDSNQNIHLNSNSHTNPNTHSNSNSHTNSNIYTNSNPNNDIDTNMHTNVNIHTENVQIYIKVEEI